MLINSVDFKSDPCSALSVAIPESQRELINLDRRKSIGVWHANPAKILGLESKVPPAHPDAVRLNEELTESRHQEAAKNFEVPSI
jgi:hypothetical protein